MLLRLRIRQDLVSFMLEETLEGRGSAAEILDHPWMSVCSEKMKIASDSIIYRQK